MNDLFCPAEHAILCDWLGLPRPDGSDLDLWELPPELEALLGPDDPEEVAQVRLRPVPFASEETARANGVARLVLNAIQDRLPQWGAANDGQVQLSRGYETRTDRPVEPLPQHLLTINWADSGPGFSWPEAYYATALPGYDRVVVTASQDSPDAYGYTDLAIGWFDAATPLVEGAKQVITQWWREVRQSYDEGAAWAYLFDEGLVSADEANAWREETWPGSEPIQDYEEDEEDEDD